MVSSFELDLDLGALFFRGDRRVPAVAGLRLHRADDIPEAVLALRELRHQHGMAAAAAMKRNGTEAARTVGTSLPSPKGPHRRIAAAA